MNEVSWLHLTDLHYIKEDQQIYWPRIKHIFHNDLKQMQEKIGRPFDFVIFTGDLVFSGKTTEFQMLTEVLQEIWSWLKELGSSPSLIAVPGNHDLTRLSPTDPVPQALKNFETDEQLQKAFWSKDKNRYIITIEEAFSNYTNWIASNSLNMVPFLSPGIIPGDFSLKIDVDNVKVGIIGLNSAFMQLTEGNFKEQIIISSHQLHALTANDPDKWCEENTVNILMTHHGPNWYSQSTQREYRADIYPPDRFTLHLFGHLHEAESMDISESGSAPKSMRQGPSLFGLIKLGNSNAIRKHGYFIYNLKILDNEIKEKFWPRSLTQRRSGDYAIEPDISFPRQKDDSVLSSHFLRNSNHVLTASKSETTSEDADIFVPESQDEFDMPVPPEFGEATLKNADECIQNIPHFCLTFEQHHSAVRSIEQASLESSLLKNQCAILVSDWGHGTNGFLATVIARITKKEKSHVFRVGCKEAYTCENLEREFAQQLGISIQEFCNLAVQTDSVFLILDDFNTNLLNADFQDNNACIRLLTPILDFCPKLTVVIITRNAPKKSIYDPITLGPLELPDTQLYIKHHPLAGPELFAVDIVEKLHTKADGLPIHIDRLIQALQIDSLPTVLSSDAPDTDILTSSEPVPLALVRAVKSLSDSSNTYSKRSFKMLQVLSFFPAGISFDSIRRVFPTEPFFNTNALELLKLGLLEVETPFIIGKNIVSKIYTGSASQSDTEKRLVVPRQVRDYICSLTTEAENMMICEAALELMFGKGWRNGKSSLDPNRTRQTTTAEYSGPGNEHSVVTKYLTMVIEKKCDNNKIRMAIRLAINLANLYNRNSRYRDGVIAIQEYLRKTEGVILPDEEKNLLIKLGKCLRMTGEKENALLIFNEVLDKRNEILNKEELAEIHLNRAFIFECQHNMNSSLEAAKLVLKNAKTKSGLYDQANTIIISAGSDKQNRFSQLSRLEANARKRKNIIAANNIALTLASLASSEQLRDEYFQKIITCKDDPFNRIRAVIKRAKTISNSNKSNVLQEKDLQLLEQSYAYLFSQRLGTMFSECHEILWQYYKQKKSYSDLLNMFRMSSFYWRIRDNVNFEKKYLGDIDITSVETLSNTTGGIIKNALNYFKKRFHALNQSAQTIAKL